MKEIVQDGAPVLRKTAGAVPEKLFGSVELTKLVKDMSEALNQEPEGVALAAPQVGVSWRLFIMRKDRTVSLNAPLRGASGLPGDPSPKGELPAKPEVVAEVEVYINPEIIKTSRKRASADEGCLSIRHVYGTTKRHERVTIRARRADGTRFQRGASNLTAQIFEHEIDHLNGILFTDHAEHIVHIESPHSQTSDGTLHATTS